MVRLSGPRRPGCRAPARAGGRCPGRSGGVASRAAGHLHGRPRRARGAGGGPLDQALVLPMLAPASYTGEDTVEFSCHGGAMPARLVVGACLAAGARAASAGEFTRRAFLNGRLSLTEAEAVADLIAAETRRRRPGRAEPVARRLAATSRGRRWSRRCADLLAELEGSLEFGEDERSMDARPDAARDVLARPSGRIADCSSLRPRADACATACRWCWWANPTPARAACSTPCWAKSA